MEPGQEYVEQGHLDQWLVTRNTGSSDPTSRCQELRKKEIITRVVEIAVGVMFRTHVYTFGGNN